MAPDQTVLRDVNLSQELTDQIFDLLDPHSTFVALVTTTACLACYLEVQSSHNPQATPEIIKRLLVDLRALTNGLIDSQCALRQRES